MIFPQRQCNVGIHLIAVGGNHQPGILCSQVRIRFRIVDIADGYLDIPVV